MRNSGGIMLINLSDDIETYEYIKVGVHGKNIEKIGVVEFSFSKDALVGFAKNLIWMYEDIDINKKFYVCTDPLGGVPSGNQVVGFYLKANSPAFVFKVNSLEYDKELNLNNKDKFCQYSENKKVIEILPPLNDNIVEDYETGFRNIANISIYDKKCVDISKNFYEVLFEINYKGLKNLAILFMKLANSYREGKEYVVEQIVQDGYLNGSGIVLTYDSLPVIFKCKNLGCAYDYEPGFGQ